MPGFSHRLPSLCASVALLLAGCSFDVGGVGFGWGGAADQGAGKKDQGPRPKKDLGIGPRKDKAIGPRKDKYIPPPPKKDKGPPPADKYVPPPKKDFGKPPADLGPPPKQDKGPPPPLDQGVVKKDTQPVSWYGRYCEDKYIGQQCPDGKTKCVASPRGTGGICTHGCYPSFPCPPGPSGSKSGCDTWSGVTGYHCLFLCKKYSQTWPCPSTQLTCHKFSNNKSHCWF